MNQTNDKSFRLNTSSTAGAGVGVFALHEIAVNTWLALKPKEKVGVTVKKEDVPEELLDYCIENGDGTYTCPPEFNHMHVVWYLNHSDEPNAEQREDGYYSIKPISKGKEITIDYNRFHEPSVGKIKYDNQGKLMAERDHTREKEQK